MEENLDTLVIALYVKIDDDRKGLARLPGPPPTLSHSELICLAVMQAMLGFESESRFLRYAKENIRHLFPFIRFSRATTSGSGQHCRRSKP